MVTARALYSQVLGKKTEKRWHLRPDCKTSIEGTQVTCFGKLFHIRAAATGKAVADGSQLSTTEDEAERIADEPRRLTLDKVHRRGTTVQTRGRNT